MASLVKSASILPTLNATEPITETCFGEAAQRSLACGEVQISQASQHANSWNAILDAVAIFLNSMPGGRRTLTPEEQQVKSRVEELARQACQETPRLAGEEARFWGTRVHAKLRQLIKAENNPNLHTEVPYRNNQIASPYTDPATGQLRWPKDTTIPDVVFGPDKLSPRMILDLKTGSADLELDWLKKLSVNINLIGADTPVFRVTC